MSKNPNTETWTEKSVLSVRPQGDQALKNDVKVKHPRMPKLAIRFRNQNPRGTYTYYFSLAGRDETIKIGRVGQVSLAFAESEAIRYEEMVSRQESPNVEKRRKVDDLNSPFKDLIEPFLESQKTDRKRSARYLKAQRVQLEGDFAGLHTIPLKMIDMPMVIRELDAIKRRGKTTMMRSRSTLSKFFNWAISRCLCQINPVTGTEKFKTNVRDVVLSPRELALIWLEAGDDEYGRIVKLLMLTAARRSQIGALRPEEVNTAGPWIELKGEATDAEIKRLAKVGKVAIESRSKNRQTFLIPLSRQAQAILERCPIYPDSPFLFGGRKVGFDNWDKEKKKLDKRLGDRVQHWGYHDFRRSFDTLGQDVLKIQPHITDACLNHKGAAKAGVRKHYNFAQYLDEKTAAMQAWGDYIERTVTEIGQLQPRLIAA